MHARAKPLSVLEAIAWIEERGAVALTEAERAEARALVARRGCRRLPDQLGHAGRMRLLELGQRCAAHKGS